MVLAAALGTILTVLCGPTAVGVPAARAAPGPVPAQVPAPVSAPVTAADRPVQITVTRFEPRTLTLGGTVEIAGTLTNSSDDTISGVSLRLQRGDRLTTRQQLADDVVDPASGSAAQAPFADVPGELDPGDSLSFSYQATSADLGLTADGVYPLLVNANGTRRGLVERIGELSSYLVVQPAAPASRTTVAWLWPLTDRPHRDATGAFTDDELAAEISSGGRLDRALDVLEELPAGGADVPVTLAVDPSLVEALGVMAGGYTVAGAAGAGSSDAVDWLARLRALAAAHPVVALPYADVDGDALQSAGLPAVLTRSLPGTSQGTAAQPTDGAGDVVVVPAPTGTPPPPALDGATGAGAAILARALDVRPRTDLAWPAGGAVRADTLTTLQAGGIDQVVLGATGYDDPAAALGLTGRTAAARVPVTTDAGPLTTLLADPTLARVVASAATAAAGPRIVEQRYLAELGVLTDQLAAVDPAVAQTVLVAPPREVDADPAWATAMLADTVTQPWLAAASVDQVAHGPEATAGGLAAPTGDRQLDGPGMAAIAASVLVRDDVAASVVGDPADALSGYDAAISRAASSAWRDDPDGFAASAAELARTVAALRERVTLLTPADGTYSLASSDAPLVLTVSNDLPFAVTVQLALSSRGGIGFSADAIPPITLEPESRTTVQVPTQVRQSGSFTVQAMLSTPAGGPLGEPVQLRVTSTAYGPITLAITIGAGALLGLLFLRRLVLLLLRRRRGEPRPVEDDVLVPVPGGASGPGDGPGGDRGGDLGGDAARPPVSPEGPPTRSRV